MRGFLRSTIGQKVIMAATGLIMVGFVILHMIGNLQVFAGPEKINNYAAMLHGPLSEALWGLRAILLVAVVLHVWAAVALTRRKQAARPIGYAKREPQVSTFAARTIRIGGVIILLFVIVHILQFTTLTIDPTYAVGDVYGNLQKAFGNPLWVLVYVVAMIALGFHLYHGLWSSVRTLGVAAPTHHPLKRAAALALAAIVWLGFTLVPVAVFAGLLR
ncbi:MAG TPA: succinate dehydrogenase cytochrome b subunit [Gemmatimonadales bacterium]|nr:succinate dehydrogenase cytochrome b subunit [Gemmatimonadales bacterium]